MAAAARSPTRPSPSSRAVEIVLKAAAPEAVLASIAALDAADAEVAAIDELLAEHDWRCRRVAGPGAADGHDRPDARLLQHTHRPPRRPERRPEEAAWRRRRFLRSPAAVGEPAGALPARLDSREDVLRALDLVIDYYRRREPGSAVPLLIERARRMVPMTFMEAIGDLAPDARQPRERSARPRHRDKYHRLNSAHN